jgi:hypothetical protein
MWAAGARKYKVQHRFGSTAALVNAATWDPILQSWANFEIVPGHVLRDGIGS